MSRFDLTSIQSGLRTYIIGKSTANEFWDEIGSTNDRAIELAGESAEEGLLVIAAKQSGGRGRQGKVWVSPQDSGIFLSIILRPTLDAAQMPLLSLAAGAAAASAIESVCGLRIGLKWVNDLVFENKKLGGILVEMPGMQQTGQKRDGWILPPAAVLGIGINLDLAPEQIPAELQNRICSLDQITGKKVDANSLIAEFLNCIEEYYNHLRHGLEESVLIDWKAYCRTLGKRIRASLGNETIEGLAENVLDSGALVLRLDSGESRLLHAGEISIRLEDGTYA